MNVIIYQADSSLWAEQYSLQELLNQLPQSLHQRALRYQFKEDAFNFVIGRLLLKEGLRALGMSKGLESVLYADSRKPYIENVHFNISHSGNLVVCAVSMDGRLGIDVEQTKSITLQNFKSFFTPKEWTDINQAADPLEQFYTYWTRKESIIKALGVNLHHLHQIAIDPMDDTFKVEGHTWYLKGLNLGEGCFGVLCTEAGLKDYRLRMVEAV